MRTPDRAATATRTATAAPAATGTAGRTGPPGAVLNLVLATLGFMVNFWAWALLGPLGPGIKERLGLSFAAQSLLVAGLFLGIGGTAFAVGVPLVSGWYPPARRGFAIGVFGVGMGGTAISNFTTVKLSDTYGARTPFLLVAAVLAGYAAMAALLVRDAPDRQRPAGSSLRRMADVARLAVTWQMCLLYAVGFGGFVAFSVY